MASATILFLHSLFGHFTLTVSRITYSAITTISTTRSSSISLSIIITIIISSSTNTTITITITISFGVGSPAACQARG